MAADRDAGALLQHRRPRDNATLLRILRQGASDAEAERRHQERSTVQVDQRCPRSDELKAGAEDSVDPSLPRRRLQSLSKASTGTQHTVYDRRQRALGPVRIARLRL